jgi:DNA-binding CsgD family transcriptional regulator
MSNVHEIRASSTPSESADHAEALIGKVRRRLQSSGGLEQIDELAALLEDARSVLRSELTVPGTLDQQSAAGLCEQLVELASLEQDLHERFARTRFDALPRIQGALARLRAVSPEELLAAAAVELVECCEFDRVLISRVQRKHWRPEVLRCSSRVDRSLARRTEAGLLPTEFPLEPGMIETEVARRGAPVLVCDALGDRRTLKPVVIATDTPRYVVAPIRGHDRVIGYIHADVITGGCLTTIDRDNLGMFAEGLSLLHEQAVLGARLDAQRAEAKKTFGAVERLLEHLRDAEPTLAGIRRPSTPAGGEAAAVLSMPSVRRAESLLSRREREVISLIAEGASNSAIADKLCVAEATVKSHVRNVCRKLQADTRSEAVAKYVLLLRSELT